MSRPRIRSLVRLRNARETMRNAAGGQLTAAESEVTKQKASVAAAERFAAALDDGLAARCRQTLYANDLLAFEEERAAAAADIAARQKRVTAAQAEAVKVRELMAHKERELRRTQAVLDKARKARDVSQARAEQSIHDDLVNSAFSRDEEES